MIWLLAPPTIDGVMGTSPTGAGAVSLNVPRGVLPPGAVAWTGDENSMVGLFLLTTLTGSGAGFLPARSLWTTFCVMLANVWACACAPFAGPVLSTAGAPGSAVKTSVPLAGGFKSASPLSAFSAGSTVTL